MISNLITSEKTSMEMELQSKSERFDYILEHQEDIEEARKIYREIKILRQRLSEMYGSTLS